MKQKVQVRAPSGSKEVTIDFQSNILVLDIYGGAKLNSRMGLFAPGEVLVLDAQGNMSVHNELDDATEFESSMPKADPPPKKAKDLEDDGAKKKEKKAPLKERAAKRDKQN